MKKYKKKKKKKRNKERREKTKIWESSDRDLREHLKIFCKIGTYSTWTTFSLSKVISIMFMISW